MWEWQYAAQGGNASNTYPWGTQLDPLKYPSVVNHDTETPPRKSVHAYDHAKAASPFGVKDLIGNIWQYTTEVRDIHTRAVVLKGAANYYPDGSKWYARSAFLPRSTVAPAAFVFFCRAERSRDHHSRDENIVQVLPPGARA